MKINKIKYLLGVILLLLLTFPQINAVDFPQINLSDLLIINLSNSSFLLNTSNNSNYNDFEKYENLSGIDNLIITDITNITNKTKLTNGIFGDNLLGNNINKITEDKNIPSLILLVGIIFIILMIKSLFGTVLNIFQNIIKIIFSLSTITLIISLLLIFTGLANKIGVDRVSFIGYISLIITVIGIGAYLLLKIIPK